MRDELEGRPPGGGEQGLCEPVTSVYSMGLRARPAPTQEPAACAQVTGSIAILPTRKPLGGKPSPRGPGQGVRRRLPLARTLHGRTGISEEVVASHVCGRNLTQQMPLQD